jgi:hypothetical protein
VSTIPIRIREKQVEILHGFMRNYENMTKL